MSIDGIRQLESDKRVDMTIRFSKSKYMFFQYKYIYLSPRALLTFSITLSKTIYACCAIGPNIGFFFILGTSSFIMPKYFTTIGSKFFNSSKVKSTSCHKRQTIKRNCDFSRSFVYKTNLFLSTP